MSQTTTQQPSESTKARLEADIKELRRLESLRATSGAKKDVLEGDYQRLSAQAIAEYGTDDPDQLETMAKEIAEKAETMVTEFHNNLAAINADLNELGLTP
jgi:hypothetical protein